MPISLLKAKEKHLFTTYRWANEKVTLRNSITGKKITLEGHKNWFKKYITSKNKLMKIVYLNKKPIGLVRLDKMYGNYYISYLIDKNYRGKRHAYMALSKYIKKVKSLKKNKKIFAIVKKNNIPSVKIFNKLKFNLISKNKHLLKYCFKI